MKQTLLIIMGLFITQMLIAQCDEERYYTKIFSEDVTMHGDISAGSNTSNTGATINLDMDIFETADEDEMEERPVIIWCYGGSFIGGAKEDVHGLCEEYAQRGFVTAAITYRLYNIGGGIPGDPEMIDEVVKAVHDGKAAVRELRRSYYEDDNPYGINPDQIYIGGISAGAILALHLAYLNDPTEADIEVASGTTVWDLVTENGGIEGSSNDLEYSSEVHGVISYSGALYDHAWMADNLDIPLFSVHETGDPIVPYNEGPFILGAGPISLEIAYGYGGFYLDPVADDLGITNEFLSYDEDQHVGYLNYDREHVLQETAVFIGDRVCEYTQSVVEPPTAIEKVQKDQLNLYPNPAAQQAQLSSKDGQLMNGQLSILNNAGQVMLNTTLTNQTTANLPIQTLSAGLYQVVLTTQDQVYRQSLIVK